jgi:hypothetical protein
MNSPIGSGGRSFGKKAGISIYYIYKQHINTLQIFFVETVLVVVDLLSSYRS